MDVTKNEKRQNLRMFYTYESTNEQEFDPGSGVNASGRPNTCKLNGVDVGPSLCPT